METKIFLKPHELNTLREIRRASSDKNILNAQKLKERLDQQGIKMNFEIKGGKVQNVSFEKDDFKISSFRANEKLFTDKVLQNLDKNRDAFRSKQNDLQKELNQKKEQANQQIQNIKDSRQERTQLHQGEIYNSKNLGR